MKWGNVSIELTMLSPLWLSKRTTMIDPAKMVVMVPETRVLKRKLPSFFDNDIDIQKMIADGIIVLMKTIGIAKKVPNRRTIGKCCNCSYEPPCRTINSPLAKEPKIKLPNIVIITNVTNRKSNPCLWRQFFNVSFPLVKKLKAWFVEFCSLYLWCWPLFYIDAVRGVLRKRATFCAQPSRSPKCRSGYRRALLQERHRGIFSSVFRNFSEISHMT